MPKPTKAQPIPDQAVELIAARFRVLGEAVRLRLLMALEEGEKNVSQLVAATGLAQTNVSRHLQTLAEAGIVARRREGVSVIYRIADPAIFQLCDCVCGSLRRRLAEQGKAAALFGGQPSAGLRRGL